MKHSDDDSKKLREQMLLALVHSASGNLMKHKANVEIYLKNPVGIGEHSDVLESIEIELDKMSTYQERMDILKKYFNTKG